MRKKHYINNADFQKLISNYIDSPKEFEDELMKILDLLITNIIESFRFNVDPDDAKQECFLLILRSLKNFKPANGSAFNYFTTIILNHLKALYGKNKRYRTKLTQYMEDMGRRLDFEP